MTTLAQRLPTPAGDLNGYLAAISTFPMLSADEERELATRLRTEADREAAWRLVTSHLRFVARIARDYRGYGLPEEDLIQEGNVGLMKAVKGFDPGVGVRLASYAVVWIRNEIHEFVLRNWRIVRVATTKAQRKLFFNLRRATARLGWLSENDVDRVCAQLDVRPQDVREMECRLHASDASFEATTEEVVDGEAAAPAPALYLPAPDADPACAVEQAEWLDASLAQLTTSLDLLDERARDIVTRRWLTEPRAKLRELAEAHGISAERVRQIEAEALATLRAAIEPAAS